MLDDDATANNARWEALFDSSLLQPLTQRLAASIAAHGEVESAGVGIAGSPSAQYRQFAELSSFATEEELRELTRHPSPAVRVYAFQGLLDRGSSEVVPILNEHLDDNAGVATQRGCIGGFSTVADEIVSRFVYDRDAFPYALASGKDLARLARRSFESGNATPENLRILQEIPLPEHRHGDLRERVVAHTEMLRTLGKDPEHEKTADWRVGMRDHAALPALAFYERPSDTAAIREALRRIDDYVAGRVRDTARCLACGRREAHLESAYYAIRNFPQPEFLPWIEKLMGPYERDVPFSDPGAIFQALARFDRAESVDLLQRLFRNKHGRTYAFWREELGRALVRWPNRPAQAFLDTLPAEKGKPLDCLSENASCNLRP